MTAAPAADAEPYAYTVDELAAMWKVGRSTVYDRIKTGQLPAVDFGSAARPKIRVLAADLQTYYRNHPAEL